MTEMWGSLLITLIITLPFLTVHSITPELGLINIFKREVLQLEPKCNNLVTIYDANFPLLSESAWLSQENETAMVADLLPEAEGNEEPLSAWESPPVRLHRQCSLVLVDLTKGLQRYDNFSMNITNWPLSFKKYPGHPHKVYYIFFLKLEPNTPENRLMLFKSASTASKLQNLFFALKSDDEITMYTRNVGPNSWHAASSYTPGAAKPYLKIPSPNFGGAPVLAMVCAVCASGVEDYKRTGVWLDFLVATKYEFTVSVNGTLEMIAVFSLPRDGINEDGEWDDFLKPTIDGEAVFAALLRQSVNNREVIYHSSPMYFDSAAFITARPKRVYYSSLAKLVQPLDSIVWYACLITVLAMIATLEFLVHVKAKLFHYPRTTVNADAAEVRFALRTAVVTRFKRPLIRRLKMSTRNMHHHLDTVHAMVEPFLDQSGLRCAGFRADTRSWKMRGLVGLWFLIVIVLNNGYRSMMTSFIVQPKYSSPPSTFAELLASAYEIGCIFFEGNIEADLEAVNTSVSRELLRRIIPFDYFSPDCYQRIFEFKSVCIGYRKVFDTLGSEFVTDVHGSVMAVLSKDSILHLTIGIGISLHYPALVEPFNWAVRHFVASGIYEKWRQNGIWFQVKKGQRNALSFIKDKSYYSGEHKGEDSSLNETVTILTKIMYYGMGIAVGAFLIEFIIRFWPAFVGNYRTRCMHRDGRRGATTQAKACNGDNRSKEPLTKLIVVAN